MPSCKAAAKKPCLFLLFFKCTFGLPELQTAKLAICHNNIGGGGDVIKEELCFNWQDADWRLGGES